MTKWPTVDAFASAMKRQLNKNKGKGGWCGCSRAYLLGKLTEEFGEFVVSITHGTVDKSKVCREAADLANIAMMIADNRGALKQEGSNGPQTHKS